MFGPGPKRLSWGVTNPVNNVVIPWDTVAGPRVAQKQQYWHHPSEVDFFQHLNIFRIDKAEFKPQNKPKILDLSPTFSDSASIIKRLGYPIGDRDSPISPITDGQCRGHDPQGRAGCRSVKTLMCSLPPDSLLQRALYLTWPSLLNIPTGHYLLVVHRWGPGQCVISPQWIFKSVSYLCDVNLLKPTYSDN